MDPNSGIDKPDDRLLVSILYADIIGFSIIGGYSGPLSGQRIAACSLGQI